LFQTFKQSPKGLGNDKVTTIAIHLRCNSKKKKDGDMEYTLEQLVAQIVEEARSQMNLSFVTKKEEVQKAAELIFRTFNIEHTGHNIKQ